MHHHDDDNLEDDHDEVSKSQRKRDAHALRDLGAELVALAPARLAHLPLPDDLRDAVGAAQQIKSHGAHKRQLQFIGKLLRNIDPSPIREALDRLETHSAEAKAALHRLERWRDRLLDEGDGALEALLEEHPDADRQHLRQLVRTAHKEKLENRPPAAFRSLFRYLRDLIGGLD